MPRQPLRVPRLRVSSPGCSVSQTLLHSLQRISGSPSPTNRESLAVRSLFDDGGPNTLTRRHGCAMGPEPSPSIRGVGRDCPRTHHEVSLEGSHPARCPVNPVCRRTRREILSAVVKSTTGCTTSDPGSRTFGAATRGPSHCRDAPIGLKSAPPWIPPPFVRISGSIAHHRRGRKQPLACPELPPIMKAGRIVPHSLGAPIVLKSVARHLKGSFL